jgi:hypothetical protein
VCGTDLSELGYKVGTGSCQHDNYPGFHIGNFLASSATVRFARRAFLREISRLSVMPTFHGTEIKKYHF